MTAKQPTGVGVGQESFVAVEIPAGHIELPGQHRLPGFIENLGRQNRKLRRAWGHVQFLSLQDFGDCLSGRQPRLQRQAPGIEIREVRLDVAQDALDTVCVELNGGLRGKNRDARIGLLQANIMTVVADIGFEVRKINGRTGDPEEAAVLFQKSNRRQIEAHGRSSRMKKRRFRGRPNILHHSIRAERTFRRLGYGA